MKKNLFSLLLILAMTIVTKAQPQDTKVIITGYVTNPAGADANREYVQLMATEDINFAETPYSVITCYTSYSGTWETFAPVRGWVTGKIDSKKANDPTSQTTKFNLTKGKVKAGEFFYAGGAGKKINGAASTDISEKAPVAANQAKWIRTLTYGAKTWSGDDGIGGGIFGALFGNSEAPQGIVVFNTTNVTEATIPVDVVFFGTFPLNKVNQKKLYERIGGKELGYRICNTDRYSVSKAGFFAKGNNTYLFPPASSSNAAAQGNFYKLGGVYDIKSKRWTDPRNGAVIVAMTNDTQLAEIEKGKGTTEIRGLGK
ncbi:hypothetical protein FW774_12520 [Pedobacter sp. BS3]|uniref:hypothetical protein n=1 Tax=Pedobacter sp. BS3 TaxID=2567937 RepID=UPI0011F05708|nr:hypothetical protein [Pedobacter sp. BS3]TZF83118.1 hypothetical protein FW774_12520 [Pedobacter sp. BS3]